MIKERINALVELGDWVLTRPDELELAKLKSKRDNRWFDLYHQQKALNAIATQLLDGSALKNWVSSYDLPVRQPKNVGLILAGNIPAVGFHDVLTVYLSGHKAKVKLSEKDQHLIPALISKFKNLDATHKPQIEFVEKLKNIDAVIATGSNNSVRYFNHYFGHLPNVIRGNRNSLAVLDSDVTDMELKALGNDVFDYYGLGCRSVSQILIPENFNENRILDAWEEFAYVIDNEKYENNFKYNYAMFMLNREQFKTNNFVILKESDELISRISCLHLKRYKDIEQVKDYLKQKRENIQVCVSNFELEKVDIPVVKPGQSQQPGPADYADGVDTLKFLKSLS